MVHQEDRIVYGKIYTQGLVFELLSLEPLKASEYTQWYDVPRKLRDGVSVFLVRDAEGNGKTIWVSHWSGYVIVPSDPEVKSVLFSVEGENIEDTSNVLTPVE